MDRDSFNVVDRAGRALCAAISMLGMGSKLTASWNFKLWFEGLPLPSAEIIPDTLLYWVTCVTHYPRRELVLFVSGRLADSIIATEGGL